MKHLQLWIWLKTQGLKQQDLAAGLGKSVSFVSTRLRMDGFTPDEQSEVLSWARRVRPRAKVRLPDLFEPEAA